MICTSENAIQISIQVNIVSKSLASNVPSQKQNKHLNDHISPPSSPHFVFPFHSLRISLHNPLQFAPAHALQAIDSQLLQSESRIFRLASFQPNPYPHPPSSSFSSPLQFVTLQSNCILSSVKRRTARRSPSHGRRQHNNARLTRGARSR